MAGLSIKPKAQIATPLPFPNWSDLSAIETLQVEFLPLGDLNGKTAGSLRGAGRSAGNRIVGRPNKTLLGGIRPAIDTRHDELKGICKPW